MNNFNCTIWQFLAFGCTSLCGGIGIGVTIGKHICKREIDELRDRLLFKEIRRANEHKTEDKGIQKENKHS